MQRFFACKQFHCVCLISITDSSVWMFVFFPTVTLRRCFAPSCLKTARWTSPSVRWFRVNRPSSPCCVTSTTATSTCLQRTLCILHTGSCLKASVWHKLFWLNSKWKEIKIVNQAGSLNKDQSNAILKIWARKNQFDSPRTSWISFDLCSLYLDFWKSETADSF